MPIVRREKIDSRLQTIQALFPAQRSAGRRLVSVKLVRVRLQLQIDQILAFTPCCLLVNPLPPSPLGSSTTAATTMPLAGQGYAAINIPLPLGVPIGGRVDVQWYVLDPGGNPLVGTMTPAFILTIRAAPGC